MNTFVSSEMLFNKVNIHKCVYFASAFASVIFGQHLNLQTLQMDMFLRSL